MAKIRNLRLDGSNPELWSPPSSWEPYRGLLPRLEGVAVALDTETRDDGIAGGVGPGWVYDMGHLCGVSVAWGDQTLYVPVRHPDTECRPVEEVCRWVDGILDRCEVHFFNAGYDLAWLRLSGCRVWPERLHDGYIASVMLDENQHEYSLDACCARAGVVGKDTSLLDEAARSYGVDPRSGLWRMPARYSAPYAEQDATATGELVRRLLPQLRAEGMEGAYQTELRLIRVLYDMRLRGIRVDEDAADQARALIRSRREEALRQAGTMVGWRASMRDMRSPGALEKMYETQGIVLPRTPKSNAASVKRRWLELDSSPLSRLVRQCRQLDDLAEKFMGTYILGHVHRGRIHAEVHQLRDSDGGTRSMRLSYSNPPLQQMPARADPWDLEAVEVVKMVRSAFLPEDGEWWAAPDYAGQEPRFVAHYAELCGITGSDVACNFYRDNPTASPHDLTVRLSGLPKQRAKDLTQAISYGAQIPKIATMMGCSLDEAEEMFTVFCRSMPHLIGLGEECDRMARARGFIKLVDGARCHFDDWWPVGSSKRTVSVRGLATAQEQWPSRRLERSHTYRALNRLCQGGAARQMKIAMVAVHDAGITPLVQMHDELGASITTRREAEVMEQCMVEAVKLVIPVRVDMEVGRDWGHAKMTLEEAGL